MFKMHEVLVAQRFQDNHSIADAREWCVERFGVERAHFSPIPRTTGRWRLFIDTEEPGNPASFYFIDEQDAFDFKMRWG